MENQNKCPKCQKTNVALVTILSDSKCHECFKQEMFKENFNPVHELSKAAKNLKNLGGEK